MFFDAPSSRVDASFLALLLLLLLPAFFALLLLLPAFFALLLLLAASSALPLLLLLAVPFALSSSSASFAHLLLLLRRFLLYASTTAYQAGRCSLPFLRPRFFALLANLCQVRRHPPSFPGLKLLRPGRCPSTWRSRWCRLDRGAQAPEAIVCPFATASCARTWGTL